MKQNHFSFGDVVAIIWIGFAAAIGIAMMGYALSEKIWIAGLVGAGMLWYAWEGTRNVRRWLKIAPLKTLRVEPYGLRAGTSERPFSDVCGVLFAIQYTKKSVNFVSSGTDASGIIQINFTDRTSWRFQSGVGLSSWTTGSHGAGEAKEMIRQMSLIAKETGIQPIRAKFADII